MKIIAQGRQHGYRQPVLAHYCPACRTMHGFAYIKPQQNGALWTFDGNFDKPTFSPSMNIKCGPFPPEFRDKHGEYEICHYFLVNGVIKYLNDCTHKMAGLEIELPDVPARYLETPPDSLRVPPNPSDRE